MTNQDLSRRAFIHTAGKAGMACRTYRICSATSWQIPTHRKRPFTPPDPVPYTQRPLPYAYTALEPAIDAHDDGNSLYQTRRYLCEKSCQKQ